MRVKDTGSNSISQAKESAALRRLQESLKQGRQEKVDSDSSTSTANISTRAKEMVKARQIATEAPDVRSERIAELRRRIANKEYNVKPEDIADRMVEEHIRTR